MNAVALHHDESGAGEPVVLAHAIGMDHRMWDDLASRLSATHRVIRFDSRGHGRSPAPPGPYSLEAMAEDALALLDRLAVAKAHWVGLSMGAMVGMAFALQHPARLGRLVLANTTSSYGPEGRAMWQARAKAVREGGLEAIKDTVMGRYFSNAFRANHPAEVAAIAEHFLATPAQGYLGSCDAIGELDFTEALSRIGARTLVIAADADAGTPPSMAQAIVERIPGARLAILAGAAHLSAVEKPAEFAALVKEFLAAS